MLVAMTGASGFIGSALAASFVNDGHRVRSVGRGAANDVRWDPAAQLLAPEALDGVDAVVHLAGEPIGERWTTERKQAIRESRIHGTRLIAGSIARLAARGSGPRVLVSASAIGYYGDRRDEWLDESSAPGSDFLAEVVQVWEAAAEPARLAGVRVVTLRAGIALNPRGGALAKMLPPFRLGAGGRLGNGEQWMSWIGLRDLVRAFRFAVDTSGLEGAANAVAPVPVTNAEFTTVLAHVLTRPAFATIPAFALRALFGELADATLLASQRVRPAKLVASGFTFGDPTLDGALRAELARA